MQRSVIAAALAAGRQYAGDAERRAELIDFRLYRLAFLPALLAVVVVMFSLEGVPARSSRSAPTGTFEGERGGARRAADRRPRRPTGPPAATATTRVADLVAERFERDPGGSRQRAAFDGRGRRRRGRAAQRPPHPARRRPAARSWSLAGRDSAARPGRRVERRGDRAPDRARQRARRRRPRTHDRPRLDQRLGRRRRGARALHRRPAGARDDRGGDRRSRSPGSASRAALRRRQLDRRPQRPAAARADRRAGGRRPRPARGRPSRRPSPSSRGSRSRPGSATRRR